MEYVVEVTKKWRRRKEDGATAVCITYLSSHFKKKKSKSGSRSLILQMRGRKCRPINHSTWLLN